MDVNQDVQQRIFDSIKKQLPKNEKIAVVLMNTLFLSQDAVYRRLRGDVPLSIYETKTLCEAYNISFDEIDTYKKGIVNFNYIPLDRIGLNFETWVIGLRDALKQIKAMEDTSMIMSVNDTPIFQLFNLPHLTRFKFFFWAKTYLKIPAYENELFKREKIDKKVLMIGIEAHNIYNSIPSTEIYSLETLRGTLRQIQYYFDARLFEDLHYTLELIDNLMDLIGHLKAQAEIGRKFAFRNEPPSSGNELHMYFNETFISDNTYLVKSNSGSAVFFSHNIMNYLNTTDPYYIQESEFVLDNLKQNSNLISEVNTKDRNRFFGELVRNVTNFKKKVELELEQLG
ncbi:MAG: hypothetical protein P8I55_14080 [Crocinitomix sp.]|nr:hypothetical protein [Crocinitomix sp.]